MKPEAYFNADPEAGATARSDERKLLLQLREGDRQAFEEIYHLYKRRLAGNLLRLLKSNETVECSSDLRV